MLEVKDTSVFFLVAGINIQKKVSDKYPEKVSDKFPEKVSDKYPEKVSDQYPEKGIG